MKVLKTPKERSSQQDHELTESVAGIMNKVQLEGDQAIREFTQKFDGVTADRIRVSSEEIKQAYKLVEQATVEHLQFAAAQIKYFAEKQLECLNAVEVASPVAGVTLGHRLIPVKSCGAYIPGGRYPLPSSALMSVITAKVAGVKRVAACCPPSREHQSIHPAVLVAMDIAGADEVYLMGGAQAIAAYTYGTQTIEKVDMIVGPGNKFVNEAKRQAMGTVGIDSLAGPSEVLIIADESAVPEYVAIDLLAQCEHDPSARGILVTTSEKLVAEVEVLLKKFVDMLPTGQTAAQAWEDNGHILLVDDLAQAIAISNDLAPEHLEVQTSKDDEVSAALTNYGSLFIGKHTPVSFGDYVSGTNHILPTAGTAKYSNGVWVGTFIKTSFYQKVSAEGAKNLSAACMHLAGVEGLLAHQKSVALRVE